MQAIIAPFWHRLFRLLATACPRRRGRRWTGRHEHAEQPAEARTHTALPLRPHMI